MGKSFAKSKDTKDSLEAVSTVVDVVTDVALGIAESLQSVGEEIDVQSQTIAE